MKAGWTEVALEEVAQINPRRMKALPPDAGVAFVGMADLSATAARTISETTRPFRDVAKGYTALCSGDLLVAKITPCFQNGKIGEARISTDEGAGSTEFHVIRANEGVLDARFALHYLRHPLVRANGERRMTGSGGQRRVPLDFFKSLRIPLPPLAEQRRISKALDVAADVLAKRRTSLRAMQMLPGAILPAPVTTMRSLGDILTSIDSGKSPVCQTRPAVDDEWAVLKLGAISTGAYQPRQNKAIANPADANETLAVRAGDVLMTRKNTLELVGVSAYVTETPTRLMLPDLIFRLVPAAGSGVLPRYLHAALSTARTRRSVQRLAGGSSGSMPNISKERLLTVQISVPSLAEQEAFQARVGAIDRGAHRAARHLGELESLFASLQHRGFIGDL